MMKSIPVKGGKNCVFRVVRVSGTIRKAEQEAIRRARELILKAQHDLSGQGKSTLQDMFGDGKKDATGDILMVDRADSDSEEEGVDSDEDG
jgi:ribonuclease P/MRP protein subunit POP5